MGPNLPNQTPELLSEQSEAGGGQGEGGQIQDYMSPGLAPAEGREGCCVSWHKTQSFIQGWEQYGGGHDPHQQTETRKMDSHPKSQRPPLLPWLRRTATEAPT